MAKRSRTAAAAQTLPSREEVAGFISKAAGKVGKREVARAFGIKSPDRAALNEMLKELEAEGVLDRRGKSIHKAGQLPNVVLAEVSGRDRDGELIAEPVEWDPERGPPPKIVLTPPGRPRPGAPVPAVGDRALIRVQALREPGLSAYAGRVIKILGKRQDRMLGIFHPLPGGGGRLVPVEKRGQGKELSIRPGDEGGAEAGDLVAATVSRSSRFGLPEARVRERLGSVGSERAVSLIAIHAHGIPHVFPPDVLAEAAKARPDGSAGREDWRDLALVTIDPPDAKDHDDAVHAVADEDPENAGGFIVTVAIADVAAYVRPGTPLDREALERGNSVYLPDRVVPMLPERISNDLCSLRPHEPRPALAVRMVVGADGRKKRHGFHRVTMRSAAKLSYEQAQAAIDGRPDAVTAPILEALKSLFAGYRCIKRARDAREPLFLDLPERKILLKPDGSVDRVFVAERLDAHRLIEEFMILANVAAAETLEQARFDFIYRVHDEPTLEKMRALAEVMASIGLKLPKQGALRPALFNRILASVEGSEHRTFVNEVVLRSQAQAEYAAENYGHFGLNLRRYAHFTSPIRRYADLIVHRALISALKLGSDGLPQALTREELTEIAARISAAERRGMAAERDTVDRLIAYHLAEQVGAVFDGQISGVIKAGLFVKLSETGADGFVPAATIGADYYRYDEATHALIGDRTGETYRLGDRVEVRLVEAAPAAGALRFEILSEGRFASKGRAGPATRRVRSRAGPRVKGTSRRASA